MRSKNIYLIIAASLNLVTALIHLIGGQHDLVSPLIKSDLELIKKTELLGVWHMVSIMLFYSSVILFRKGFVGDKNSKEIVEFIGLSYVLFGFGFIGISIYNLQFAPQWTLLLPIGILTLIGIKKQQKVHNHENP